MSKSYFYSMFGAINKVFLVEIALII
jgi:hypothetical protein